METPQNYYWKNQFKMPNGWTLFGHSRARERTCFAVKEIKLFLDAGIGCETLPVHHILLTHSHFDHAGALPQLLRGGVENKNVFLPLKVTNRVREYCTNSWAMKVDDAKTLPAHYIFNEEPNLQGGVRFKDSTATWVPMEAGNVVPLQGKGDKNGDLFIHGIHCYHTVSTVGYVITEKRAKLKEQYRGLKGPQLAQLRKDGVDLNDTTFVPKLAYLCDSTHEVFFDDRQKDLILQCPVIITECSFLQPEMDNEATKRGHTSWGNLRPVVENHPEITFILCHFSHRYREEEIISFFETASSSGSRPSNVVVWVESAIPQSPINDKAETNKSNKKNKNNNNNNKSEAKASNNE